MTQTDTCGGEQGLRTTDGLRKGPPAGPRRFPHVAAALYATGERAIGDELTRKLLPYARERLRDMARCP